MSLNIKSRETEDLARELADITGETMTGAVATALRERLDRVRSGAAVADRAARIRLIGREAAGKWALRASPDELLYDELGLPR